MLSVKTIRIVNKKHPEKFSNLNEEDFDPKKHTLWETDVPPVQELNKNKSGRPKGSKDKKKRKRTKKKRKKQLKLSEG